MRRRSPRVLIFNFLAIAMKSRMGVIVSALAMGLVAIGSTPARALDNASWVSIQIPHTMVPGQTLPIAITLSNTGTTTWTAAGQYKLGSQDPQDNLIWGTARVNLASTDAIAPGQQKTFRFNITAPLVAGTYACQWRMLVEGTAWFGASTPISPIQVGASGDQAYFVSQSVPTSLNVGSTQSISVTMSNTGSTTWTNAAQYRLGTQNPQDNVTWGTARALLPASASIAPGQQFTFTFNITAPSATGTYNLEFRMLREGVAWFGDVTPNVAVAVGAPCVLTDLSTYFVPNYAGWDTAKRTWVGSDGSHNTERWFSYAAGKYEHIKFSDPQSAEMFAIDSSWIYITAENKINDTPNSRAWPPGTYGLGLRWLTRYAKSCPGCTAVELAACNAQNHFTACHSGENEYTNCQFTMFAASYCGPNDSTITYASYAYGYAIGTLPSFIKRDLFPDNSAEEYYYGLGRGLLRYELYDSSGRLVQWAAQTGEVANQPIPDQVCLHP